MRYPPEHRERTRRRILAQAARLFRRSGYGGVGIDRIMAASKLTRGGFYGYFRSKAQLFAEVIAGPHDLVERLRARSGDTPAALRRQALDVVAGYLAPHNRGRVGRGCTMASLAVDVARVGRPAQAAFSARLRELSHEFGRGLAGTTDPDPRALASIALCVGGLVLARAAGEEPLATQIEDACRDAVTDQLSRPTP